MSSRKLSAERGFTIIELLIATAVLSTILLLVTILMINIGNLYYKGINQARIQDNTRSLSDELSQHLQLGSGMLTASGDAADSNVGQSAYCVGNVRYTYIIGIQIGSPAPGSSAPVYPHILWRDDNPTPGSCSITGAQAVNLTSGNPSTNLHGTELIAPKSRLINFSITGASPYAVSIGVAYGDNDLLCSSSVSINGQPSCSVSTAMPQLVNYTNGNLQCKGSIGDQFCATSSLNTNVVQRLH